MINYRPKPYINFTPKFSKGQVVRVVATNKVAVIATIAPESGGFYYLLEGLKGAYAEIELESVK